MHNLFDYALGFITVGTISPSFSLLPYRGKVIWPASWKAFGHSSMFTIILNPAHLYSAGEMKMVNPEELLNYFYRFNNFHNFLSSIVPKLTYALIFF